jgi:hypothetical protein
MPLILGGLLDAVEHRLEFADERHVAVDAQHARLRQALVLLQLLLDAQVVLMHGDAGEFDDPRSAGLGGVYHQGFGHVASFTKCYRYKR